MNSYKLSLNALRLLYDPDLSFEKLPLPHIETFDVVDSYNIETKNAGRFKTIPPNIILDAIKNAIEFHFKFGDSIIESYTNLLQYLESKNDLKHIHEDDFLKLMSPKLQSLGVRRWNLLKHDNYYNEMRSNASLGMLIKIYYGAVLIVVGALMARRSSDLASLIAGQCVDETGKYLLLPTAFRMLHIRQDLWKPETTGLLFEHLCKG